MKLAFKTVLIYSVISTLFSVTVWAQQNLDDSKAYKKVVTERADKIVVNLGITEADKTAKVRDIIAQQYIDLNEIHDTRNNAIKNLKEINKENKEKAEPAIKRLEEKADKKLKKLHKKYIAKLNKNLSAEQVEKVKDGMTYGVLPITYKGYQEMLPNLTVEQKKQILLYLTEAREYAMDAESSEKKHGWFGKYKGKINNYLSKAGIDMNKASKEWQQRIKDEAASKKTN
ncbi:DUF3826 domain-containing protein [Pedobacter sp. P351]|uniref:DUF3826 domain-containing protein n=1 Tax=Pedobacter superstes TaxID=3133441 RepID=UPI0030988F2A